MSTWRDAQINLVFHQLFVHLTEFILLVSSLTFKNFFSESTKFFSCLVAAFCFFGKKTKNTDKEISSEIGKVRENKNENEREKRLSKIVRPEIKC